MRKLVIVGTNTIHTYNFIELVKDFFEDVLLITDKKREDFNIKTIEVDFSLKLKNIYLTSKEIKSAIEEFSPSLIHIHQANSVAFFTYFSGISKKYPTILTAWGSDILVLPHKSWLLKKMVQYNLGKADAFTSDSVFMADEMKRLSKNVKSVLIANFGINVDFPSVVKENIIYSNRLHKQLYNIDKIIKAFEVFKKGHSNESNWKLVIGAVGEETENLKMQVAQSSVKEDVEFIGWVDKNTNELWYSKSKIWVSIPDSDATSISLLEAMACGCIPIVSALPANKEWIEDGVNGLIVEHLDSEFISRALELDENKLIEMNKLRIEKDGLKSSNRLKFIHLYKELLKIEE